MTRYEYRVRYSCSEKEIQEWLNAVGAEGFALVRAEADSRGYVWFIAQRKSGDSPGQGHGGAK